MDALTRIVVPGGAVESWLGSELVTPTNPVGLVAGAVVAEDSSLYLNAVNEAGGVPPNTGLAWPAGRHRVTFDFVTGGISGIADYTYRVRNITDSNNAATVSEVNDIATTDKRLVRTLEFDSVAGKSYQPQIVDDSGDASVEIFGISHTFIPYFAQNEQAHTDPASGIVHMRDSSGNFVGNLGTEGEVPFMVPPGLTAIFIIPLDVPKTGYTEPESVKGRTVTVTATGSPRYTG